MDGMYFIICVGGVDNNSLRILSLDGGGVRGVLSISLLKHVMEQVGREPRDTFDIICGTSTGGLLAALLGRGSSTFPSQHMMTMDDDDNNGQWMTMMMMMII